jgi:hypothetical protein
MTTAMVTTTDLNLRERLPESGHKLFKIVAIGHARQTSENVLEVNRRINVPAMA